LPLDIDVLIIFLKAGGGTLVGGDFVATFLVVWLGVVMLLLP
jgi:hypothetical protein